MNKSAKKFAQTTDRLRAILGDAIREYRNGGKNTEAAIEEFAPFTGLSRHQIKRYFYNEVTSQASDHDLDRVSLGFIEAMLWLAAFFEEKAQHCRRKAYAETMSRKNRLEKCNGENTCPSNTSSQIGLAA